MDGSGTPLVGFSVSLVKHGMSWPPDFIGEVERRDDLEREIMEDATGLMLLGALEMYRNDPVAFVNDCVWVFEPRNSNSGAPVRIPVVTFPAQARYLRWLHERFKTRTSAPVEKSRDSGASWMACTFAVWLWLFHPGSSAGFGSRVIDSVDQLGNMDTLFEKIRSVIRALPPYLVPKGLNENAHFNFRRIINPENGATIKGEGGDNIGRGGRTSIFFVDEAAFIAHPKMISAALSANTDCRIDISSSRAGTVFQEWCDTSDLKFIFDIRDAPWHTEEWIAAKEAEHAARGEQAIFAQEYLRDPTAAIEGQLIPSIWVDAAIDLHKRLKIEPSGVRRGALDVANGGADRNAVTIRHGILIEYCESKIGLMADGGGAWAYAIAAARGCKDLLYDSIGVGAGAAAVLKNKTDVIGRGWSASGTVIRPHSKYQGNRSNADMFGNAKDQAWWLLKDRFYATYVASKTGQYGDADALISLDGSIPEIRELKSELSQVTFKYNDAGKIKVNKTPPGHKSPNRADSVMIAFAPEAVARVPSIMSI